MRKTSVKEFSEDLKDFFDEGVISEVYSDDDKCLCNVANYCYICFPYYKDETLNSQIGLPISAESLKKMIDDRMYFYRATLSLGNNINKSFLVFDDALLKKLLEKKKIYDVTGPSNYIDKEMEEEIMGKGKKI